MRRVWTVSLSLLVLAGVILFAVGLLRPAEESAPAPVSERAAEVDESVRPPHDSAARAPVPETEAAPAPEPPAAPPQKPQSAAEHAEQVALRLTTGVKHALDTAPRFRELRECERSQADCSRLRNEALESLVLTNVQPSLFRGELGIEDMIATYGREATWRALERQARRDLASDDATDRVLALAVLGRVDGPIEPLEPESFANFLEKSEAEQRLLLREYQQAPLSDAAVSEELLLVATNEQADADVRFGAMRALARPATAPAFEQSLRVLQEAGEIDERLAVYVLGPALGRCGSACQATFARLLGSEHAEERLAALIGMSSMPAGELQQVEPTLVALEPSTARERSQLQLLQHKLGGDDDG